MENSFNNRDFEQFVKSNADQYRMIPSEKVWKGVNNILHTRRKWYGLGLTLLLLLTAVSVTWVMVSYPVSKKQAQAPVPALQTVPPVQSLLNASKTSAPSEANDINSVLSPNKYTSKKDNLVTVADPTTYASANSDLEPPTEPISLTDTRTNEHAQIQVTSANRSVKATTPDKEDELSGFTIINTARKNNPVDLSVTKETSNKPAEAPQKVVVKNDHAYTPPTIESVVNSYQVKKMNKNLTWQLYFAPTVSYRKLSENKSFQNSPPFSPGSYPFSSLTDVNREVVHKPDMGLEFGVSTKYPLTKNLKLTGGLQFNINRYDIKAFVYNGGEQATISLSGESGNNTESVSAWTYYRNYKGSKGDWLKNFYFTVSAPIGAELTLFGNDKTSFGISGTVQPTYILSDRAYLISTDYKNYAEIPWLIRHINVNTSFGTFISYTNSRNTRWQVGPQVRYQVLSSFQNKYPVKENLFDFGLRIGVTLNQ